MITTVPDYFDEFHCLAGSCPDTCCGQWEIVVDEAAEARYRSVSGDLGQRIRAALVTMDGETCMALEHSRCPLLTAEGLCPIVTELGEDFLSETCHTHPRFTEVYGGLRETMLSISCPEAARLLLTRTEPLTFVTTRDDAPPEPNDLDGDLYHLVDRSRAAAPRKTGAAAETASRSRSTAAGRAILPRRGRGTPRRRSCCACSFRRRTAR